LGLAGLDEEMQSVCRRYGKVIGLQILFIWLPDYKSGRAVSKLGLFGVC